MSRLEELKHELHTLGENYAVRKKLLSDEIKDIESGMIDSLSVCDYCRVKGPLCCGRCCYSGNSPSNFSGKKVKQV
jgi:hypothetical protein